MFIGVFILLMGIFMLLEQMNIISGDFSDYLLAIAMIALGASIVFDKKRKH